MLENKILKLHVGIQKIDRMRVRILKPFRYVLIQYIADEYF